MNDIAIEAVKKITVECYGESFDPERPHTKLAVKIILAAIEKARPHLKNLKMLDDIHKVVIQHSGNQELADSLWCHLRADGGNGAIAPPAAQPQPRKATPRGERSDQSQRGDGLHLNFPMGTKGQFKDKGAASSEPPKEELPKGAGAGSWSWEHEIQPPKEERGEAPCTCGNLGPEQGIPSPLCKVHGKAWSRSEPPKRHHYDAPNGFPCSCGKPIDDPIHIPRVEL